MRSSTYYKNLMGAVIEKSEANNWEEAVKEWDVDIDEFVEDVSCSTTCTCGKYGLRYLYTIRNLKNNNTIFPIGSTCIKEFNREDLNYKVSILESMYLLYRALRTFGTIDLDKRYFSRKLIDALYSEGAFINNKYNRYNAETDYIFIKDMFNKRGSVYRNGPSEAQKRKIYCIIKYQIKPFLYNKFDDDYDSKQFVITDEDDRILNEVYGLYTMHNKTTNKKQKRTLKVDFGYIDKHGNFSSASSQHDEEEKDINTLVEECKFKDKGNTLLSLLLSIEKSESLFDLNTNNDSFPDKFRHERISPQDLLYKIILDEQFEDLSDKIIKSILIELRCLNDEKYNPYIEMTIHLDD